MNGVKRLFVLFVQLFQKSEVFLKWIIKKKKSLARAIWIHATVEDECLNKAESEPRQTRWQWKKKRGYILGEMGSLLEVADFRARALEFLGIVTLKRALGKKS